MSIKIVKEMTKLFFSSDAIFEHQEFISSINNDFIVVMDMPIHPCYTLSVTPNAIHFCYYLAFSIRLRSTLKLANSNFS